MNSTETECRAVEIVYERENGMKTPYSEIQEADQVRILAEIRARAARIEQSVVKDMLMPKLTEQRFTPRRMMVAALTAGGVMLIVILLLLGAMKLV